MVKRFVRRGLNLSLRLLDWMEGPATGEPRIPAIRKAEGGDMPGRFREIISDPLNLLIERAPYAGFLDGNEVLLHNGNRVALAGPYAYYAGFSQILILNRGVHEPLEEYVFQELLRGLPPAPLMVELGAYWGHYSMWLKKVRPNASVILVEPEARNLRVGRHNFERNGFTGEFVQAFVGPGQFEVDAFLQSRGIGHLDLLHVDIQGYEVAMLKGAGRALEQRTVDYFFISTHQQNLHEAVVGRLSEAGYRIEVSSDFRDGTTSFDGFVFASSPDARRVFDNFAALGRRGIVESGPRALVDSLLAVRDATHSG